MKILFLGSPYFAVKILKRLLQSSHNVVAVVTQSDKPSGRGQKLMPTQVKQFATEKGIPVYSFDKLSQHLDEIEKIDYDIAVTASFGQILNEKFLSIAPCINVHPSLLPKYRGATPIQSALLSGDKVTGVSIMEVVRAVDAGDVIAQKQVKIEEDDDYTTLQDKLADVGGDMLVEVLDLFALGQVKTFKQDDDKATFCRKLEKSDAFLDLNKTASEIVNQSRALCEMGVFLLVDGQRLKVGSIKDVSKDFQELNIGEMAPVKGRIIFGCKDGAVEIGQCLSKNGKMVPAKDFLNGFSFEGKKIN
mgnify:CR=1 FL=1